VGAAAGPTAGDDVTGRDGGATLEVTSRDGDTGGMKIRRG
jgi:hypothetical protein